MKTYRVKEEWQRAGVYYVRTQAMVYGFNLTLQGEFADDTPESEYILVTDDNDRPLSTNRIHVLPERGFAKIERVVTLEEARGTGAGRAGIISRLRSPSSRSRGYSLRCIRILFRLPA